MMNTQIKIYYLNKNLLLYLFIMKLKKILMKIRNMMKKKNVKKNLKFKNNKIEDKTATK